ncbi:diacylglycerol kinase family lipid kinase [Pseudonocardiaceae bacterium YIM PH 21723]|nr:diacylglycerol kinase family lipid kinase [Pseudonocardiaceae bacterium YIM PH 21723]
MRALLVVNPQATSTTPAGRDVLAHALAATVKLDVVETRHRGHAAELAAQARQDGMDLVVAHGGDGTVNEVVNGLLSAESGAVPQLGVVPGGSANVFARALGLPRDPIEATYRLLQAIEGRVYRTVGLGKADDRWFTFNAGIGWDGDVVAAVERKRAQGAEATPSLYARMAFTRFFAMEKRDPALTLELPDGQVFDGVTTAFLSNTDPWSYVGPRAIHLNPGCTFDGGLGLYAWREVSLGTVFRQTPQILARKANPRGKGLIRFDSVPAVTVRCARPMRLQVDGDYLGTRSAVSFTSVPEALRVTL